MNMSDETPPRQGHRRTSVAAVLGNIISSDAAHVRAAKDISSKELRRCAQSIFYSHEDAAYVMVSRELCDVMWKARPWMVQRASSRTLAVGHDVCPCCLHPVSGLSYLAVYHLFACAILMDVLAVSTSVVVVTV